MPSALGTVRDIEGERECVGASAGGSQLPSPAFIQGRRTNWKGLEYTCLYLTYVCAHICLHLPYMYPRSTVHASQQPPVAGIDWHMKGRRAGSHVRSLVLLYVRYLCMYNTYSTYIQHIQHIHVLTLLKTRPAPRMASPA